MNLQARRISGSSFTAEDKLEVVFNSDNLDIARVLHTIELVSGSDVSHGGGAVAGEYLHYKSYDDAVNGVMDYSSVNMNVTQLSQGTSVINVVCAVVTVADEIAFVDEYDAWKERKQVAKELDEVFNEEAPIVKESILETGPVTLDWSSDIFV